MKLEIVLEIIWIEVLILLPLSLILAASLKEQKVIFEVYLPLAEHLHMDFEIRNLVVFFDDVVYLNYSFGDGHLGEVLGLEGKLALLILLGSCVFVATAAQEV
jgi:hypothetical protein